MQECFAGVRKKGCGLPLTLKFAKLVALIYPCVTNYLRPDHLNGAQYDIYMATALQHAVTEISWAHIMKLTAQDWQKYDVSVL